MPEYEALEEDLRDYSEGEEIYVVIKDKETFENIPVRASIHKIANHIDGGEKLWIRSMEDGSLKEEPWFIEIIEEIPYDEYAQREFERDQGSGPRYGTMKK